MAKKTKQREREGSGYRHLFSEFEFWSDTLHRHVSVQFTDAVFNTFISETPKQITSTQTERSFDVPRYNIY